MAPKKVTKKTNDPFKKAEAKRTQVLADRRDSKKSTSAMPKTKRGLGATDAGQAQRVGGLKAAG